MVDYYLGQEYRTNKRMRWTYRKTFVAVAVVGFAAWASVISLAKYFII